MDIIYLVINLLGYRLNNGNLKILGYNLVCTDHPSNSKRGGVCIYYKALLSLRGNIINSHRYLFSAGMHFETFEVMICDKQSNLVALYMSLSQSQDIFDSFTKILTLP